MKRKHAISALQLIAAVAMFPLFFTFIPWASSTHISELSVELAQERQPPEWAEYFTVGHGTPSYFRTSPREEPIRATLHGGALVGCVAFLILSTLHYTKLEEKKRKHTTMHLEPISGSQ